MYLTHLSPSDYVLQSSRDYSIYVCETRSIPRASDGLKDGQRKALWLMRSSSEKIKTYALAGKMGAENLYVHGEVSACNAISLLAAPWCNNVCLFEGVGAFGTRVAPTGWGAPRYTYVKRSKAADLLLYRDLEIVPLRDNYDGSTKEPVQFLPLVPLVLLNGVAGVAVGWSTDILPRSLKSLIGATRDALNGRPLKNLQPSYEYLSLKVTSLGGNAYEFSGAARIVDTSTVQITELPPDLSIETFRKRLNELEDQEKIHSYTDRSTRTIDITVKFKRGAIRSWSESDALDFFKLRQRKTERIVVIDWEGTRIVHYDDPAKLVQEFVQWRLGWYTVRYQKMVDDTSYERRFWLAVRACIVAALPRRILRHPDRRAVEQDVKSITDEIGIDERQLDRLVSLPTYRWSQDFIVEVDSKLRELDVALADYQAILSSPQRLKGVYDAELEQLKRVA